MIDSKKYEIDSDGYKAIFFVIGKFGTFQDFLKHYLEYRDSNSWKRNQDFAYSCLVQGIEANPLQKDLSVQINDFYQEFFPEHMNN